MRNNQWEELRTSKYNDFNFLNDIIFQYLIRTTFQGRHDCEENTAICGIKVEFQEYQDRSSNKERWDNKGGYLFFLAVENVAINGLRFKCCPIGIIKSSLKSNHHIY